MLVVVRVLGSSKHPFRNKYFRNMDVRLQLASAIVTLRYVPLTAVSEAETGGREWEPPSWWPAQLP